MTRTHGLILTSLLAAGVLTLTSAMAQPPSFDRLSDTDRQTFQERFAKEVWPLMERGGKDGCVGCHNGKGGGALRLRGDAGKDFALMLREGFFLPDDAGSLLARITDKSPKRRMPPKGPAWSEADVQVLRAFVRDLDKKQK
jgi:hypothetical protein